jgi:tetratricopeptide (TPR) repeat protein
LFAAVFLTAALAVGRDNDGPGRGGYDAPYFQADFTQDLNSWTSALVNPALMYRVNQMHASMAFYRWGLDRGNMGYQDFSLLFPIRLRHTAGLTLLHARNSMERVRPGGGDGAEDFDGFVTYQDMWMIGNYSFKALPWLTVGSNVKLRSQTQFGRPSFSTVPGLDVGLYINPFDHYHWGDFGISLMAQDILPTQTPWAFEDVTLADIMNPSDLITVSRGRVGLRYAGLNDNLVASFEMIVDNAFRDIFANLPWNEFKNALVNIADGGPPPTPSQIADMFPIAFRWGFHVKYMFIPQIWFKGGWTNNNIPYLGFSYNYLYPLPEMINYFTVDYNFGYSFFERSADLNDERGLVMMIRASTDFGKTREQRESRRLYNKLVVAPMDTYQEAMRLYVAGRYWEAAFAFGKLITLFPQFYLNDKAVYYMGDSYKQLYMNQTAREVFREALDEYTTSDMRAFYLYGIMALDYREDNYDEAMRNHSFIINLYGDSEIVGEAEYLAGEIEFSRGDLEAARRHLELVKPTDRSYLYALYTLSIVNHETDRAQAAIQNLRIIIEDTTSQVSDAKLQNAAAVKLGHIFYEMGDRLRDAAESYSLVPRDAVHGDEALLGLAWTWIKAGQPQQALQNIDRLLSIHPQSPFIPEAHLVRGYVLMLLRRFQEAIPVLERAIALANASDFLTDENVRTRKVQNDRIGGEFAPDADRIKANALRRPTPRSLEERPELQRHYEVFAAENQEFFEYRHLARTHRHFFKRKEEIIDDATFALARATSLAARSAPTRQFEGLRDQGQRIDDEIERLQMQLEQMETDE